MNIRHYMALYDNAEFKTLASLGYDDDYIKKHQISTFDLQHHVHYLNEIAIGDKVELFYRLVGLSKTSVLEVLMGFVDLKTRRMTPPSEDMIKKINDSIKKCSELTWESHDSCLKSGL
eukprot:gene7712-12178_t